MMVGEMSSHWLAKCLLLKSPLVKCPLAKSPLAKCLLAKCPLAKCPACTQFNTDWEYVTPCLICSGKDVLVGYAAAEQAEHNPQNTVYDAKRFIGKGFTVDELEKEVSRYPFKVRTFVHRKYGNAHGLVTITTLLLSLSHQETELRGATYQNH